MPVPDRCPVCPEELLDHGECATCGGRLVGDDDLPVPARDAIAAARVVGADRTLTCPGCGEPMISRETRGVVLDRCDSCRATWFDAIDADPGALSVADLALFTLSVPERATRSIVGGLGGAAHEAMKILLPGSLRQTRLYRSAVEKALRFLVEDVGGITGRFDPAAELHVARAAVGSFLDTAGLVFLHASPIWVLAAVSDLTRGTKIYLRELNDELVRQQVLPEGTVVDGVEELLGSLELVADRLARDVDQPPLSIEALRASYAEIRREIERVDPERLFPVHDRERTWNAMRALARSEGRSMFEISTAIAMASRGVDTLTTTAWASITVGAGLLYQGVFKHYGDALATIHAHGYWATVSDASLPYLQGAANQLSASRESLTERLLSGRLIASLWRKKGGAATK